MSKEPLWDTLGPPPLGLFVQEQVRAAAEFVRLRARRADLLRRAPRGDGHPVLVIPGFLAPDLSTAPLRGFLRLLCYDARRSQLGINLGPSPRVRDTLERRLRHLAKRHERKVSLVGWSLGGLYARELARAHPALVRTVITMGTPFADISATRPSGFLYRNGEPLREAHALREALGRPLALPTTSIYSRTDGIVHWQSCLEAEGPQRENVEVHCSHTGMGFHPEVLRVVADRLALAEGEWIPYRRAA